MYNGAAQPALQNCNKFPLAFLNKYSVIFRAEDISAGLEFDWSKFLDVQRQSYFYQTRYLKNPSYVANDRHTTRQCNSYVYVEDMLLIV